MESVKKSIKKLVAGIPGVEIRGGKDAVITGLSNHSKKTAPGDLFFAKKGSRVQGHNFISEAVAAGALAVATDLFDPFLKEVVQVVCKDVAALESMVAARFYDNPSHSMLAIGVTGTNGKTTSVYLIRHLLARFRLELGLIGTLEWIVGDSVFPSISTTPDVLTVQKLFYEMKLAQCAGGVMEVSSHGLDQNRVSGIDFDIALFTNLTQDHLDYHHTMESYAKAKARLFSSLQEKKDPIKKFPKRAVLNADDPWVSTMKEGVRVPVISYGVNEEADIRAEEIELSPKGTQCFLHYRGEKKAFFTPLIGQFNIYNCLGAIGVGLALGYPFSPIIEGISSFEGVPGRLERVENGAQKHIFVDYAHTEDSLRKVLGALKKVVDGKLVCVFGCGGDRDRLKRPKMGLAAQQLADEIFVTSDNPRSEVPEEIIEEILAGMQPAKNITVEVDREVAIARAIKSLGPKDVLLIAGKGHETGQIFKHQTIHFDDRIVAKRYC